MVILCMSLVLVCQASPLEIMYNVAGVTPHVYFDRGVAVPDRVSIECWNICMLLEIAGHYRRPKWYLQKRTL